jgi:hypothetical protein
MADLEAAFRQQFLDLAVAEGEPVVEPDGVRDHLVRDEVAVVRIRAVRHGRARDGRKWTNLPP